MVITTFLLLLLLFLSFLLYKIHLLEKKVSQKNFRPISFFREPQLLELIHMINRLNAYKENIALQVHCEIINHKVIYYLSFYQTSPTKTESELLQKITWVRYSDYVEIKKILHSLITKESKDDYVKAFAHLSHLKR